MSEPQTTVRSLDDPAILVQTPATIYDTIPPLSARRQASIAETH